MSFDQLGLPAALLRAVSELGYATPTPIQQHAIPAVHQGRDLLAAAQTGTGKTAAFALPLLQRLDEEQPQPRGPRAPRLLVLVPTRELAAQVGQSFDDLGRHLHQLSQIHQRIVNVYTHLGLRLFDRGGRKRTAREPG